MTGQAGVALRDAVLGGAFTGAAYREAGSALAGFLLDEGPAALAAWFGPAAAPMAADPIALRGALDRDIVAIDDMVGAMLDAILHHPRLQALEGSWRGLRWLAANIEPSARVKLRLLSASWTELCRDLERAPEFDQSQTFRRIYEDEFGTAGGEPYGMLVMDYRVRHRRGPEGTDDVAALSALSAVAAAAFAPMVFAPDPSLFGVDSLAELDGLADPASGFGGAEHQRWRNLAGREDTRFIGIALPRLLARLPWDEAPEDQRGFRYAEVCESGASRLWFSAGFAVALAAGRAFQDFGWPADMRGYETDSGSGGVIAQALGERFSIDPAAGTERFETELALTDGQERALAEVGFMPLATLPWGGEAVLASARSLQAPRRYASRQAAADANLRLSAQFSTMICVSRFAHFVKIMGRNMVGGFRTADEIQETLRNWLKRYVNANRGAGADSRARFPLLSADVAVNEIAGRPGVFGCVIQMQPHFQLDDVAASFRLVTELAAAGQR